MLNWTNDVGYFINNTMSYETWVRSNAGKHPTVKMLQEANKELSKLKVKKIALKFPNIDDPKK